MSVRIEPDHVYHEHELRALGLFTEAELKRARDAGELTAREVSRGRRVYLGRWLLDWLTGAEGRPS